jgi:putative hydrolase
MKDIFKFLSFEGPVHWEMARQLAVMGATGGEAEPNVEPLQRIRLEELLRVAELRVADATGLSTSVTGGLLSVRPVTKTEWALKALDDWKPLLEGLATSLGQSTAPSTPAELGGEAAGDFLGDLTKVMGPMLMSVQIGGMAGHLAQRATGQYEPPLPRPVKDELVVVIANVDEFAHEWSLPLDDVRLWVLLHEITWHAILGRPHVRSRLQALLEEYVNGFHPNPLALEERLGDLDPMQPEKLQEAFSDPEALLGAVQTDEQRALLSRIETLIVPIVGYVDHVLDTVGRSLIGSYGSLHEALRRRQMQEDDATRFLGRLLGLEVGKRQFERGNTFVRGVLERSGPDDLAKLWTEERNLPTPAELDAPGLWLARIELPGD